MFVDRNAVCNAILRVGIFRFWAVLKSVFWLCSISMAGVIPISRLEESIETDRARLAVGSFGVGFVFVS